MDTRPVYIFITMDSDVGRVMEFHRVGRSSILPFGAIWQTAPDASEVMGWWEREATDENIRDEIRRACPVAGRDGKKLPLPIDWSIITLTDLPITTFDERTFRDAWVHDGTKVVHDMEKAKTIKLDLLRQERAPKLVALDADWMKATGQGNKKAADDVEAKRQALRDLPTAAITSAATVDDLKAIKLPE